MDGRSRSHRHFWRQLLPTAGMTVSVYPIPHTHGWGKTRYVKATEPDENLITMPGESMCMYRGENKGLYVVARNFLLLLLNCSAWPCQGPA